jgi:PBSX family phage terminase large subunit
MKVILPAWKKTLNETFIPLVDDKSRYLICYGGRGSSKSVFAAKKLIWRCLSEPYFRYVLIRNTYATIKDSSYQTIKDIIFEWGLQELFEFKLQPLEIHCANGNFFLARGCDDTAKMKSMKDITGAWYEEDIPSESDFITITTSIRTTKALYLQEIFTINPEVEGNYREHWFWQRFFKDQHKKTFTSTTKLKMEEGDDVDMTYTCHHSTYRDNRWIPKEFIAFLRDLKNKNPYYWTIYCEGEWGNKEIGGRFYKGFDITRNVGKAEYNPLLPLHISFDENVNPYFPCGVFQIDGTIIRMIDLILGRSPENTVKWVCGEFIRRYYNHKSGLYIYGDATSKKSDVKMEKGYNLFSMITNELKQFRPVLRVPQSNPSVKVRGDFMNEVMASNYENMMFIIDESLKDAINEYMNVKEAPDGTKLKENVNDKTTGVKYQPWGHISDLGDYMVCEAFRNQFLTFQRGGVIENIRTFRPQRKKLRL